MWSHRGCFAVAISGAVLGLAAADATYAVSRLPVAGESFRVTVSGTTFAQDGARGTLTTTSAGCTGTAGADFPASAAGGLHSWTVNDGNAWAFWYNPGHTRAWGDADKFVCVQETAGGAWIVVPTAAGVDSFHVFSTGVTFTIRPIVPVVSSWSAAPLAVTIHGVDLDTASGAAAALATLENGCPGSPAASALPGVAPGYSTDPNDPDTHTLVEFTPAGDAPNVFVCIRTSAADQYYTVPMAAREAMWPAHVDGTWLPVRKSFAVFEDLLDFTNVYPAFTCDALVAGSSATCSLTFSEPGATTLMSAVTFAAADFTLAHLTDGAGNRVVPLPGFEVFTHGGNPAVRFTFTPTQAGGFGSARVMYKKTPVPLLRDQDDPLGTKIDRMPKNESSWLPDKTLFRFAVQEATVLDAAYSDELVQDGGAEAATTAGWTSESPYDASNVYADDFGSGFAGGDWRRVRQSPLPIHGMYSYAPEVGTAARMYQRLDLTALGVEDRGNFVASVRYYHFLNSSDPLFSTDDSLDGMIRFLWETDGGDFETRLTVAHQDGNLGVYYRQYGSPEGTAVSSDILTLPTGNWALFTDTHFGFPNDVTALTVVIESDNRHGSFLLFDSVSLRAATIVATTAAEVAVLAALFNDADGADWTSGENWGIGDPCSNHWEGVTCRRSRVIALVLSQNNLRGILPDLTNLAYLRVLDLSGNALTGTLRLPASVERVEVAGNLLSDFPDLPVYARFVDARDNRLTQVPTGLWESSLLEYADFSFNAIEDLAWSATAENASLPEARVERFGMVDSSRLRHVDFSHNQLAGELPAFTEARFLLAKIDFSSNGFNGMIPSSYGTLPALRTLHLSHNRLVGDVPTDLLHLPMAHALSLTINGNLLSGVLPAWIGRVSRADIRNNGFKCPLPQASPGVLVGMNSLSPLDTCDDEY
ncbi:Receptor protein kinase-like protein ZAR1 [Diplonema papillatum]|nr:Receptor protein kinase-like protein ZAR1 [Diplonema papillatum]